MPSSIDSISNWYKYSQIEYFTPFMKLWLCFNAWYKHVFPSLKTDAEAIEKIKEGGQIKDSFTNILTYNSEEAREFKKALAILIKEIRIAPLQNNNSNPVSFAQSDIVKNYSRRKINTEARVNNIIELAEEVYVTSDTDILFTETITVIYEIRCYLIHGSFDIEDKRAHRLVKNSYIILEKLLNPVITGASQ